MSTNKNHPFLQLVPKRIKRTLDRIQISIWKQSDVSFSISATEPQQKHLTVHKAKSLSYKKIDRSFTWGEDFQQLWIHLHLDKALNEELYLHWDDQGESTIYFNDTPYAGFDPGHTHIQWPKEERDAWIRINAVNAQMWPAVSSARQSDGSYLFKGCSFVKKNLDAWATYWDLEVLYRVLKLEYKKQMPEGSPFPGGIGTLPELHSISPFYRKLCRQVDKAINVFESEGLSDFREALKLIYDEFPPNNSIVDVILTGHGHIDLVWLWTEAAAKDKIVHTFSNVKYLMDRYPELCFGFSQSAAYRAAQELEPQLLKEIKVYQKQGRWEANGAAEVECDTQIPCGEALYRNLMLGKNFFNKIKGSSSEVFWLPDTFGYSSCMPQIMNMVGAKYFFTTKLTWGTINKFPYSSFIWKGNDGSEVIGHVTQGGGYNNMVTPEELTTAVNQHRQSDFHSEVLLPTGYGDGGGGVSEAHLERARRFKNIPNMPNVKWGRINDFYERLESILPDLPVYSGELYLQYHRGVLTTWRDLKKKYRKLERKLQSTEALSAILDRGLVPDDIWQRAVFTHFHDYLPGTSIQEVYEEGLPELDDLAERLDLMTDDWFIDSDDYDTCYFNPLGLETAIYLEGKGWGVLPPLAAVAESEISIIEADFSEDTLSLENSKTCIQFNHQGEISCFSIDGKVLSLKEGAGSLIVYVDHPHLFPAWDIDRPTLDNGQKLLIDESLTRQWVDEKGKHIQFTWRWNKSVIKITYSVDSFRGVVHVSSDINWQDQDAYLRYEIPTQYQGKYARFGSPFGSNLRSQQKGMPYDEAQWEVAGSRWASISDDGEQEGLFIVSEDSYGFSARDGVLTLSLVRSPIIPNSMSGDGIGGDSLERLRSDIGRHEVNFALGYNSPFRGKEYSPAILAETLFADIKKGRGKSIASLFPGMGTKTLVPVWVAPGKLYEKEGIIIRFSEAYGSRGKLKLPNSKGSWSRIELPSLNIATLDGGYDYKPYEVVTLLFCPN